MSDLTASAGLPGGPLQDPLPIAPLPHPPQDAVVAVPGSKSITNRALVLAALGDARCTLSGALFSDDSHHLMTALRALGFHLEADPTAGTVAVTGRDGAIPAEHAELFVGLSGTAARFLTPVCALGSGSYRLDGTERMRERPMGELLRLLEAQGSTVEHHGGAEQLPFTVHGAGLSGGTLRMSGVRTSQMISAMLMTAPFARTDTAIRVTDQLVSAPFVALTASMMEQFGAVVSGSGAEGGGSDGELRVATGQHYRLAEYRIEPDVSSASYFFAAAAVTGGRVTVRDIQRDMLQGDLGFLDVLARMGCEVSWSASGVAVQGPEQLRGVAEDMRSISDMAPTLAAMAPFADRATEISGIGHTREQESDRIHALVSELRRLGIGAHERADGLVVEPGLPRGGTVASHGDHRIAMSFAITALAAPDICIGDPGCVAKTFPDFFSRLETLRRDSGGGSTAV